MRRHEYQVAVALICRFDDAFPRMVIDQGQRLAGDAGLARLFFKGFYQPFASRERVALELFGENIAGPRFRVDEVGSGGHGVKPDYAGTREFGELDSFLYRRVA